MLRGRRVASYLGTLLITLLLLTSAKFAVAQDYGGYSAPSPTKSITVEKMVGKPTTDNINREDLDFVDNLTTDDARFAPNQLITFRVIVTNTSNVTLHDVQVKDFVPGFLIPITLPGDFDDSSRTITFNAGDFDPNDQKTFFYTFKVASIGDLPSDQSVFCETNKVDVSSEDVSDEATSQFCVEKQVTTTGPGAITTVPSTGPEMGFLLISSEVALLGLGVAIRKYTNK